jgi:hypothetical protein
MPNAARHLALASAALGCVIAIAACGSSTRSSTTAAVSVALVKYSGCMRSNGVPDFPDPSSQQGPNSFGVDGYNFNLPSGLNSQAPAYVSAQKTCQHLVNVGGGGPHPLPAKAGQAALAHAECMRKHGVPNFPDPIVHVSGGGVTVKSGGPGLNPRSPAFQQAQKACQPHP